MNYDSLCMCGLLRVRQKIFEGSNLYSVAESFTYSRCWLIHYLKSLQIGSDGRIRGSQLATSIDKRPQLILTRPGDGGILPKTRLEGDKADVPVLQQPLFHGLHAQPTATPHSRRVYSVISIVSETILNYEPPFNGKAIQSKV